QLPSAGDHTLEFKHGSSTSNIDVAIAGQCKTAINRYAAAGVCEPAAVKNQIGRGVARRADATRLRAIGEAINAERALDRGHAGIIVAAAAHGLRVVACAREPASSRDAS